MPGIQGLFVSYNRCLVVCPPTRPTKYSLGDTRDTPKRLTKGAPPSARPLEGHNLTEFGPARYRHRWARGVGEEYCGASAGPPAALPFRRYRVDVPSADVAGVAA